MKSQKKALIVYGGWDGHEPALVSARFARMLEAHGWQTERSDTLDSFLDAERLKSLDLIVPCWTMGKIAKEQLDPVLAAVASGVGIAGCHGGMCDSFRESVEWQFMTGGQWVAHPGNDGIPYRVNIRNGSSPIVEGLCDFDAKSEHYYLHVDPAVEVLASTRFPIFNGPHAPNGDVAMPVAWTKRWGFGRVFYCALGHHDDVFEHPTAAALMERGLLWAGEGAAIARASSVAADAFDGRML